jgi:hypothetical protein
MLHCGVRKTDEFFNAGEGEGDEDMGDLGLEVSGFTGSPVQAPEDPACDLGPAPPSPIVTNFMLAVRTSKDSLLELADTPAGP